MWALLRLVSIRHVLGAPLRSLLTLAGVAVGVATLVGIAAIWHHLNSRPQHLPSLLPRRCRHPATSYRQARRPQAPARASGTQKTLHPPKSPLGAAIRYALNQWKVLGVCLADAAVPLDNNADEGALRRVALGRKNFLFVGHEAAGRNLAALYGLVATCEANGVNPVKYLADVLGRLGEHPNSRLHELLLHASALDQQSVLPGLRSRRASLNQWPHACLQHRRGQQSRARGSEGV